MNTLTAPSQVQITSESPKAALLEYGKIVARNAAVPVNSATAPVKAAAAAEALAFYENELAPHERGWLDVPLRELRSAISAADNADATLGLLSGTLILQRALPLMQYEYPLLGAITQDFSAEPGKLNQTETSRIVLKPAVQSYNNAVDSSGRPLGWNTVSPAQTVDVPVTLDEYVGVPLVFGSNLLSATIRNLFEESAPQALYALGGYAVNKLTALFTAANYNAYKGTSATGGATTSGDTTIVVTSSANLYPGQAISGTGIPANCYIASVTDATHAKLTRAATATNTGLTFALGDSKVPTTYSTYVKAQADFNMASLGEIRGAFSQNEVPQQNRFALLNSAYYSKLAQDPNFNTFFAATRQPEIITDGMLPKLQGFNPVEAPWLPTSANRVGFAGHKAAAILKTRLPADLTQTLDAKVPGTITTVTAPGGLSVLLVQYASLRESYAEWRCEVQLGAAVGERRAGLVITSS
jgi:hypothetical protein